MTALTNYAEAKLLDHILGTTPYTAPVDVYAGLFTVAPSETGGGTEVSGNGYSRQMVSFAAASGGSASSNAICSFTASGGNWGSIVAVGLFDASTTGNLLLYKTITSVTINNTDTLNFNSGNITVTLD